MSARRRAPASAKTPSAPRACPICGNPATPAHRPFCSVRCAEVDLNRWIGGTYVIRSEPGDEDTPVPAPDKDE